MQNQIESLTKSVNDMNLTIQSLENEKLEILKMIPNKPSQSEIIHKHNKEGNNIRNQEADENTTKPNVKKEEEEDNNDETKTKIVRTANKVNDAQ